MAFRRNIRGKLSTFYYVDRWVPDRESPGSIHINKSTRCADKAEAEAIEEQWMAEAEELYFRRNGQVLSSEGILLSEAADQVYKAHWQYNKTGDKSRRQIDIIIELVGDMPLTDLSGAPGAVMINRIRTQLLGHGAHVVAGRKGKGRVIGPDTVDRYMAALKKLLNYYRNDRMMADLVVPPIKAIGAKRARQRELFPHEEKALFAMARSDNPDMCDVFEFLLDTGLRVSEALALSYLNGDIQLNGDAFIRAHTLKRKNNPPRIVHLTQRAKEILIRRQPAFPRNPFPYTATEVSRVFRLYRKAMGIEDTDFVPHMLRHTCTTRLLALGYELPKVQAMLGHSNERMTLYYNRHKADGGRGAAELLDKLAQANRQPDRTIIDPKDLEIARLKKQIADMQKIPAVQNLHRPTDTFIKDHGVVLNLRNGNQSRDS